MSEELSLRAQAIAAGYFGLNPKMRLTLQNIENRLTPENAEAMQELIHAGLVKADEGRYGAVTYSLTEKGKATDFKRSFAWMEKHGRFSLTAPAPPKED